MSVYGRGTKNGQYIRERNSYDSFRGESCSNRVDDPFSHGFDYLIENARNKVICEDKRKENTNTKIEIEKEFVENLEYEKSKENNDININNEKKYKNNISINKSIFISSLISSLISIISICNLWILINNFNPNSIFITLSFILNLLFFVTFLSKYLADTMMKDNKYYYQHISKIAFILELLSLFCILINTYYILKL